ncbi:uncharacterized protein LOC113226054 [Hyposmocoma kahamanoa]|uniref:uncharacterized protein LOC113226054 n=1 Tax=Hyposmocoma kahamanoa TaxID=1477025 RepID=UPI000E6D5E45|nr:uncharacterized protein LOC113226054 [Hyposmocoma kahamanoa]
MEIKSPKIKKKSSMSRLVSWSKMFRTPILVVFLLGTSTCDTETDIVDHANIVEHDTNIANKNYNSINKNVLSDMRYLRRNLNKQVVNFIMTDVLQDGEVENRIHFNGITAKETYVGSDRSGIKLRQLTDGRHLVQVIYAQNGDIQDCEFIPHGKTTKNFLKTLRKELKLALDEQLYKLTDEDKISKEEEKFIHHFGNVTFRILKSSDEMPTDVAGWLDYDKLKMECLQRHEELKYMVEHKNRVGESSLARSQRSLRENFIVPGTKWCGAGQLAEEYNELGSDVREDRCCRSHDNCRVNIGAFKRRFGYFNYRPFTVSHCRCDRRPKRDAMELLRVPGTKWCGKGFSATRYSQLGGYTKTDRCCRVHDLRCPFWIGGMEKKYGLFNWRVNTLMHCRCDERFRACLKLADTSVSNMVGKVFFNVVQTKCFVLKPVKMCTQRSWWGKCLRRGYMKQAFLRDNLPY